MVRFAGAWTFIFKKGTPGPSELATPTLRERVPPLDCLMCWVVIRQWFVRFLSTPRTWKEFLVRQRSLRRRAVFKSRGPGASVQMNQKADSTWHYTRSSKDTQVSGCAYLAHTHSPGEDFLSSPSLRISQKTSHGPIRVVSAKAKKGPEWFLPTNSWVARDLLFSFTHGQGHLGFGTGGST